MAPEQSSEPAQPIGAGYDTADDSGVVSAVSRQLQDRTALEPIHRFAGWSRRQTLLVLAALVAALIAGFGAGLGAAAAELLIERF